MTRVVFRDAQEFKAWNDTMVEKYDIERFHDHPSPFVRYVEGKRIRRTFALLAPGPRDRVLEVGCGAGHLLKRLPAGRRFGLDLSESMLRKAQRRVDPGTLLQANAESLPFRTGAWDRVYCSEVLEHLADPRAALAEIERIVATHGVAVVSVPNERLINTLKAAVRRAGLSRAVLRTGPNDYAMPERMDDEWHLHTFDLKSLLDAIPRGLRVARVEAIPFRWLPLRYVARCEPADPRLAAPPRPRSWLAALSSRWGDGDLRAVRRRIREWLRVTPCDRMLDAGCGAGELASLAPADYLGLDPDAAAVGRARHRYRRDARKRFRVADAAAADLPRDFFDVGLVHGTAEPGRASLDAIARATRGPIVLVQPAGTSLESLRASLARAGLGVDRDAATREHRILLCRRGAPRR